MARSIDKQGKKKTGTGVNPFTGQQQGGAPPPKDNITQLYKQTLQQGQRSAGVPRGNQLDQLRNAASQMDRMTGGNLESSGWYNSPSGQQYQEGERFARRKQNAGRTINNLRGFLGTEQYQPDEVTTALQNYLTQDAAAGKFAPNAYRAPNKFDLVNSVHAAGAPGQNSQAVADQQASQWLPYIDMMRTMMMQNADVEYQNMMDKASTVKDPDRRAAAENTAATYYGLRQIQANAIAASPTSNDENSIMSILAAFNQGQATNTNKLYGGAANVPDVSSGTMGQQAYDDDFVQQLLAGQ